MMKAIFFAAIVAVAAHAGLMNRLASETLCQEFTTTYSETDKKLLEYLEDADRYKALEASVQADISTCIKEKITDFIAPIATVKDFFCSTTCSTFSTSIFDVVEALESDAVEAGDVFTPAQLEGACGKPACSSEFFGKVAPAYVSFTSGNTGADSGPGKYATAVNSCFPTGTFTADEVTGFASDVAKYFEDEDGAEEKIAGVEKVLKAVCTKPIGKKNVYCGTVIKSVFITIKDNDCEGNPTAEGGAKCCQAISKAGCCLRSYSDFAKAADVPGSAELAMTIKDECKVDVFATPTCPGANQGKEVIKTVKFAKAKLALKDIECGKTTADLEYAVTKIVGKATGLSIAEVGVTLVEGSYCAAGRRLLATGNPSFDTTLQAADNTKLTAASTKLNSAVSGSTLDLASESATLGSAAGVDASASSKATEETQTETLTDGTGSAATQSVLAVAVLVVAAMLF